MKTIWLAVAVILIASAVGMVTAEEAKKTDIQLYDGKPGEKIGDMRVNPKDGAEMVWVSAGEFSMGSNTDSNDAKPQRKVYLDGYWMYKYPVTVAQYKEFCKSEKKKMPKAPKWGWKDDHPIVMITWEEAAEYARWSGASLPTEAQWEKASRGTDGRAYPWGEEWDNSVLQTPTGEQMQSTQPVGSNRRDVSPFHVVDTVGNVAEWCADWYDPDYYKSAPTRNPPGPTDKVVFEYVPPGLFPEGFRVEGGINIASRVWRGGTWRNYRWRTEWLSCTNRGFSINDKDFNRLGITLEFPRDNGLGFRCVVSPAPLPQTSLPEVNDSGESVNAGAAEEAKKTAPPLYDGKPGTKIGDVCVNPKDGAEMVWVPAGEFLMGSTDEQIAVALKDLLKWLRKTTPKELSKDIQGYGEFTLSCEKPQHKVMLDGYWMYKNEITVAQYKKFCKEANKKMPSKPKWGWIDNHPMVNVSWQDAVDYSKWAESRLPTEAQWEKAARGTDGRLYPWGNEWDASKCANGVNKKLESPKSVGSFPDGASPYGALDMAGNVIEWCADWYCPYYLMSVPTKNPTGPSNGVTRVLRGGVWVDGGESCFRCASRFDFPPDRRSSSYGFRCAKTL